VAPVIRGVVIFLSGVLVAGGVIAACDNGDDDSGLAMPEQASPDTAPVEFAYLDSARVLAYIGQIQGGLAATLTRTLSAKTTTTASITAKDVAAAETASENLRGSSETVTLTEADRFYTLLRILRADQGFQTLVDIDATITERNSVDEVREQLGEVEEGDFVRIHNARLFVPPYAAVLPRARFASYYLGGDLRPPRRVLYAPVGRRGRLAVVRYKKALKDNPRLPMVVPTLHAKGTKLPSVVTFFLPARYRNLSREASLLGGELTVVGKVIYKDHRLPGEVAESAPIQPTYLDRETLTTFAPALRRADGRLLERLKLDQDRIVNRVRESLTIQAPVAVIIPIAVYQ